MIYFDFDDQGYDLQKLNNPNLSLFYYKYFPKIVTDSEKKKKKEYLERFVKLQMNTNLITKRIQQIRHLSGESNYVKMKNISRFMCGIGYTSTVEWGMNFDWTSGIPYLPGSSFKGALLSYLEFIKGKSVERREFDSVNLIDNKNDNWKKEDIIKVFGPQGENDKADTGGVIFFDVYPEHFAGLEMDVITPHYQKYYSSEGTEPPSDTENPNPIPFLTIKPGSRFMFAFRVRDDKKVDTNLAAKLKRLIVETGNNFGFGAKTSSGYGYFQKTGE